MTKPMPDPEAVVELTLRMMGGREAAFRTIDAQIDEMRSRWDRDVDTIGRILRAHLFVEYYLTQHIIQANPRLGSVSGARLSFSQKVELLDTRNFQFADMVPGLKLLNVVRNRLAHRHHGALGKADADAFNAVRFFRAMREEGAKPDKPTEDPLMVYEAFAQYAGNALAGEFNELTKAFAAALSELRNA